MKTKILADFQIFFSVPLTGWTKFAQERYFRPKARKTIILIKFSVFFRPDLLKKVFSFQNNKSEHHHRFQHIPVN